MADEEELPIANSQTLAQIFQVVIGLVVGTPIWQRQGLAPDLRSPADALNIGNVMHDSGI